MVKSDEPEGLSRMISLIRVIMLWCLVIMTMISHVYQES